MSELQQDWDKKELAAGGNFCRLLRFTPSCSTKKKFPLICTNKSSKTRADQPDCALCRVCGKMMSTLRPVSLRSLPSCGKNGTLAVALPVGGKKTPVRLIKGNNRLLVNSRRCAAPTAQLGRGFMCSARPLAHNSQRPHEGYHEVVGATPSATAAQGFKWLDDLARRREQQAGFTFKEKDFSKPFAMGVVKIVAGPPVGREQTVQDCFKSWSCRLQQRKRRPSTNPTDRIANHVTATHSAPGGGKTTLLDYLALYLQDLLRLCEDEELKQILQRAVPISVTFNGGTNLRTWELDDTPQFNLLLRVLFSYYCDPVKSSYEEFYWFVAPMLRGLPGLSLRRFLSIVEAPVVLLVDELMKAGSDERCGAILSEIGNALNEVEDFNVLVTTLDTNPLSRMTTSSGRPINWIFLSRLSLKDSLTLIAACRSAVPQAGSKEGIQVAKLRCVRQATSDCAGHPRSLQCLADVLQAMTDEEIRAMQQSHTRSETYVALMKKVVDQAMFRLGASVVSNRALILPALIADEVALDATPAESSKTYRELIMNGVYLNALSQQTSVIPELSPLLLWAYASSLPAKTPFWNYHTQEQKEKVLLLRMLESANHNHASPGEKGEMQEHFHTHWEVLRRLLHPPGKRITLQHTYTAQALVNTFFSEKIEFLCTHKYPPLVLDANFDLDHSFPSSAFCDRALAAAMGKHDNAAYSQLMLRCRGSQPGFDAVTFEESVKDGLIALNIECRYSTPTTKGTPSSANRPPTTKSGPLQLTLASVFNKYRHTMNCYEKLFAKGPTNTSSAPIEGIRQRLQNLNRVFFVMAAFRDLSFELPPSQPTIETRYTMEDFIADINNIENNHQGYKQNILSALNNHGHSCDSLDDFLSLQAGKELPIDTKLFAAFLPPRVLVLDRDRLTASYGPSLASRPAFLAHQAEEESTD